MIPFKQCEGLLQELDKGFCGGTFMYFSNIQGFKDKRIELFIDQIKAYSKYSVDT